MIFSNRTIRTVLPAGDLSSYPDYLIQNTKSVCRRAVEKFDPMGAPRVEKDSRVYLMLKHGPLPAGDYSYLVKDGAVTKYARWLLIASELGLSFMELLILSRIYCRHIQTRNSDNKFMTSDVLREQLHGPMGFDFSMQGVIDMITALKKSGYCKTGIWNSVCGVTSKMNELERTCDSELVRMNDYFDVIFQSSIYNSV